MSSFSWMLHVRSRDGCCCCCDGRIVFSCLSYFYFSDKENENENRNGTDSSTFFHGDGHVRRLKRISHESQKYISIWVITNFCDGDDEENPRTRTKHGWERTLTSDSNIEQPATHPTLHKTKLTTKLKNITEFIFASFFTFPSLSYPKNSAKNLYIWSF